VAREGDHDGALGRNEEAHPIERLTKERTRAHHRRELLRPLVPVQMTRERAEAETFSAREDDGPEVSALSRPRIERTR